MLPLLLSQAEAMGLLQQWYALAEKVGIGAAFVLGIACFVMGWFVLKLWGVEQADKVYHRETDRQTLIVLQGLTQVLDKQRSDDNAAARSVLEEIKEMRRSIIEHIDRK